jgi:hypothetical protein
VRAIIAVEASIPPTLGRNDFEQSAILNRASRA